MEQKAVYVIDGHRINDRQSFYDEISEKLIPGVYWGRNLDAFDDILRGGFGTPDAGFIIRWDAAEESRLALGSELFDTLVEIIRDHGAGGRRARDGVELQLA
ncbi:MAG: barstar family protein [Candidatus Aquilonibacter sp.]